MKAGTLLVTFASVVNGLTFLEARDAFTYYTYSARDVISASLSSRSGGTTCPAIWTTVVGELTTMFLNTTATPSQCNGNARASIRAAFHDCGTWNISQGATGGCDGSLILAGEAFNRPENNGLQDISNKLLALQKKYPAVTVADLIQVASSVAIVTCPGGPRVQTFVGRKDSSTPNPPGFLPDVKASGDSLYTLFQNKGFDSTDLAALVGAHTTSTNIAQTDIPVGGPQDSTPGVWDIQFYQQTLTPPAGVYPFQSDKNLAAHPVVGKEFNGFVGNQGKWTGKFASAMLKMSLLGVPGGSSGLIDCTNAIPKGTNNKREMKGTPINDRIR